MDGSDIGGAWEIVGARVLGPEGLAQRPLWIEAGRIAAARPSAARRLDAGGLWALPGIVDVHGDAFERIVMPRPGVTFPLTLALAEADRQLIANGITTAFHGLTLSWEPGLRSLETARATVAALRAAASALACDTRFNFRWETFAVDAVDDLLAWLAGMPGAIVSVNDHTTPFLALPPGSRKLARMAERMGMPVEAVRERLAEVFERRGEVPAALARVAAGARAAGAALFAHDETEPAMRAAHRALGIGVCEFPMTVETAEAARDAGEPVVLGAPNVLRGGSQNGAIGAAEAVEAGLCTALASDYYYPAPLLAAFALADRGLPFTRAWAQVSAGPAEAAGLADRGRLEPGLRADVLLVDPAARSLRAAFVGGRHVYARY
jgi:alpha-D-ribose 1-methylphosphonate 5-triphosphate diphosphatase